MNDFPDFMKRSANKVVRSAQAHKGSGRLRVRWGGGSQMAFWTCSETAFSTEHAHDFDEYMIVVQGCYTLIIDGQRIPVNAGEEYVIPSGVLHGGEVLAGTRTIHAFGGHRAERESLE